MRIINIIFLTAGVFFYVSLLPLFGQNKISINEILENPEHFYNQTVKIEGKVVEITTRGDERTGTYILENDGKRITLESTILPELESSYNVTIQVLKMENRQEPVFKEISRSKKELLKYFAYIFGGIALVLAVALVYGGSGTTTSAN